MVEANVELKLKLKKSSSLMGELNLECVVVEVEEVFVLEMYVNEKLSVVLVLVVVIE